MQKFIEKKIAGLNVKIDRTTCIASENCITAAPELFGLDDDRICEFKNVHNEVAQEKIIEACSVCPVNALYVYDSDGSKLVP
ncbi:MAG: ferredoxin [Ignavibacteriaceae bacterium]